MHSQIDPAGSGRLVFKQSSQPSEISYHFKGKNFFGGLLADTPLEPLGALKVGGRKVDHPIYNLSFKQKMIKRGGVNFYLEGEYTLPKIVKSLF